MIKYLTPQYHDFIQKHHYNAAALASIYQSSMELEDQGSELLESDFLLSKELNTNNEMELLNKKNFEVEDDSVWLSYWRKWQEMSQHFEKRLADLKEVHQKHMTYHIGKSNEQHMKEKEDIQYLTDEMKEILQEMQVIAKRLSMKMDSKIYEALSKRCVNDWMELANQFQKEQEIYLKSMDSMKQKRQELSFIDHEQDIEEMNRVDEMMDRLYDRGFTDEQIELVIQNRRDVIRRDKELSEIVESIVSLQELFTQLNALVMEQGTLLDRIDFHVEKSHLHVQQGTRNLVIADNHDRRGRSLTFILLIIIAVFLILSIIFIKLMSIF